MRRGFEGCLGYVKEIETLNRVDRHITSTLEIGRVHFYVIIKPPPISFTVYRTQENIYGHINSNNNENKEKIVAVNAIYAIA